MIFTERQKASIWLSANGFTSANFRQLLKIATPEDVYANPNKFVTSPILTKVACNKLTNPRFDKSEMPKMLKTIESFGAEVAVPGDENYPQMLIETGDAPGVLYMKGDIELLKTRAIAVVGSRSPSAYGAMVAKRFAGALALAGITVISGLASGIDAIAHEAALDASGKTIAVIGSGLDIRYPSSNEKLYERIEREGLIVSEYFFGEKAIGVHFPARNRIISGLSQGTLVCEGGQHSGSIITAKIAVEQNRNLYIVPSRIDNPNAAGSNELLQKYPLSIAISPDVILNDLKIVPERKKATVMQLDFTEEIVVTALKGTELKFDELLMITKLSVSDLNVLLYNMELKKLIKRYEHNSYGLEE